MQLAQFIQIYKLMHRPPEFQNRAIILGVKIDDQPLDYVMSKVDQFIKSDSSHKIFTPNPEICLQSEKDDHYRQALNLADINIPDGFGLKLGALILGEKLENRVTGADLTKNILDHYKETNLKVFVVLRNDSLTSTTDLEKYFQENYPNIKLQVGEINKDKPFDCDETLNKINNFQAQIVFVALGAPNQELWIDKYLKLIPSTKIALGIGGSFDFITGKMQRAPKLIRDLGMEWFYRLYKEPKRLKRIKNATTDFLLKCHAWKTRIKDQYRNNVVGVVHKDGKYLVMKNPRFKEHWQFPQGGVDDNETTEQAAIREVSEEVGINQNKLKIIKAIPETHSYDWKPYAQLLKGYKGQKQTAYLLDFSGQDSDFDLSDSHEAEKIKWVEKENLLDTIHQHRHEFVRKIIKHL